MKDMAVNIYEFMIDGVPTNKVGFALLNSNTDNATKKTLEPIRDNFAAGRYTGFEKDANGKRLPSTEKAVIKGYLVLTPLTDPEDRPQAPQGYEDMDGNWVEFDETEEEVSSEEEEELFS
jgi:hypothetical protein